LITGEESIAKGERNVEVVVGCYKARDVDMLKGHPCGDGLSGGNVPTFILVVLVGGILVLCFVAGELNSS
jgi:hypothetical protein